MAKLPKLATIQAHLRAHQVAAATPVRPRQSGARTIPLHGSSRPIDAQTLAQAYDSNTYTDPGISFGPGTPPIPQPLDNTGQPRQQYYTPGANLLGTNWGRRIDPALCQALVDNYDIFRQAIYLRIDEIACMDWDIAPDKKVLRTVKDRRDAQDKYRDQIIAARAFFKKPDKQNHFQMWIRNLLEDHFVFDAMTLYKRRTRGGELYGLNFLDGSLIKPMHSLEGRTPEPPEVAYQQYVLGIPRFEFTADELIYRPKNVRPRSLIGFSVAEQFILHINTALRFQAWNTAFFTDGNIPSRLLTAPQNWSADKIEEWQQIFDALLAGDPAAQRKLFMVPPGVQEIGGGNEGQFEYATEFSKYLIDITCVATGVTRQELGLEPGNSEGLGGSGLHEAMATTQNHRLVRLATFLADTIFTPLLQEEFGLDNFVWVWPALEKQDPQAHAELNQLKLYSGQLSFDEMLMEDGQEPVGIGRMINLGGKLLFEEDLKQLQAQGTLATEQQQAQQQAQTEVENQKALAEHQAGLQQQTAEHQAGLQQQTAEHAAGLDQQAAEHQAGLQQQAAEHQADLQQQQIQVKGDMDLTQSEHAATLTQAQLDHEAQIAAQQSQAEHTHTMEQAQTAGQYAREKTYLDYQARTGLPATPASGSQVVQPAMGVGPIDTPSAVVPGLPFPDSLFNPNNTRGLYARETLAKAAVPDAEDPSRVELDQWRRKVEKGMKAGKTPSRVPFTPNILDETCIREVKEGLVSLEKVGPPPVPAIRNLFKAVGMTLPIPSS